MKKQNSFKTVLEKNPFYFAFIFPALVDSLITILGQDHSYWKTTNKIINEASPAYFFLAASPWLFVLGSLVWFVGWYWIFLKLPEKFKLFLMFLFVSAHSWGTGSWFVKLLKEREFWSLNNIVLTNFSWILLIIYFAIIAFIATSCVLIYFDSKTVKNLRSKTSSSI